MSKKVAIIGTIDPQGMALFDARPDVTYEVLDGNDPQAIKAMVAAVDGILVRTAVIDEEVIASANRLAVVSRHGVGYDQVDVPALTRRGIPLTIAIHGNAQSVAEHAMFMLLAVAKKALHYDRETRRGNFGARNAMDHVEISGRSLLVIGFGRIGSRVVPRAQAFGMRVHVYDPYVDQSLIEAAGAVPVADLRAALAGSDAVTVHVPLTGETEGMIGAVELAALPDHAIVINTARGGIVDEAALVAELRAGTLFGAGFDVFVGEPTPPTPDHPLFHCDNVVVTPHNAGVSRESAVRTAVNAAQNVLDVFDGVVDPAAVVNAEVLAR